MGHRAWFAWHCLDRDEFGKPPSLRGLERPGHLANNSLSKLIWDKLKRPGWEQLEKMARALQVTPEWLQQGSGVGPVARWPVLPRPDAPRKKSAATISAKAASEFESDTQKLVQGRARVRRDRAR